MRKCKVCRASIEGTHKNRKYCDRCYRKHEQEYRNEWGLKQYRTNEEYRNKMKACVRHYLSTARGKATHKAAMVRSAKKHPDYMKKYMVERRNSLRKKGICTTCAKNNAAKGGVVCGKCRKKAIQYYARSVKP